VVVADKRQLLGNAEPTLAHRRDSAERLVDVRDVHSGRRWLVCKQGEHRAMTFLLAEVGGQDDRVDAGPPGAVDEAVAPAQHGVEVDGPAKMGERTVPELQEVRRHHAAGFLVAHEDAAAALRIAAVHEDTRDEPGRETFEMGAAEAGALDEHTIDSALLDESRVRVGRALTLAVVLRE